MRVMLLGATGLTGGKVLQGLLGRDEVSQVVALGAAQTANSA